MTDELISIIIPVYNTQTYLEECLNSVINQTYNNLQVIIINDGSTDGSEDICKRFQEKDNRIEYFYQKNQGVAATRNKGVTLARGKYICFIDSDDYVHVKFIEILYSGIAKNDADLSMCMYSKEPFDLFDSNVDIRSLILNGRDMMLHFFQYDIDAMNVLWNKIYKKELLENETFPVGLTHEELVVNAKVYYNSHKVAFFECKPYYYRTTENSIINSSFSERKLDVVCQIENRMLYFFELNEKEIYERFLQEYEVMNLKFYYLCKKNKIIQKKFICNELRRKYKYYFKETIKSPKTEWIKKLFLLIGLIAPYFSGAIANRIIKE